jgi:hypothetical protein
LISLQQKILGSFVQILYAFDQKAIHFQTFSKI